MRTWLFWRVLGMMQGGLEVCARSVGGLSSLRGALMGRSAEWEWKGVAGSVGISLKWRKGAHVRHVRVPALD